MGSQPTNSNARNETLPDEAEEGKEDFAEAVDISDETVKIIELQVIEETLHPV